MYDSLKPGDVVVADALFDDYFIAWEFYRRDIDIVARAGCRGRAVGYRRLARRVAYSFGSVPTSHAE